MCNGIIYKATCLINGKVYIGRTINGFNRRKRQHERCSLKNKLNYYFYNALRKYGIDSFKWEIIDTVKTENELNLLEQLYIEEYRRKGEVYNLNDGRGGMSGFKIPEKTKRKMSKAKKGKLFTEEHKRKLSEALKGNKYRLGHKPSKGTCRKLSEAGKGRPAWNKGEKFSDEIRLKMSEAQKGNKYCLGHKQTEEHKEKISKAQKGNKYCLGLKASEKTRAKMSLAHKGHVVSLKTRKKISESLKARRERELRCA